MTHYNVITTDFVAQSTSGNSHNSNDVTASRTSIVAKKNSVKIIYIFFDPEVNNVSYYCVIRCYEYL